MHELVQMTTRLGAMTGIVFAECSLTCGFCLNLETQVCIKSKNENRFFVSLFK